MRVNTILFLVAAGFVVSANAGVSKFRDYYKPDAIAQTILIHPINSLEEGAPAGVDLSPAIHHNFSRIIDQNFALRNAMETQALINSLSEKEFSDLARFYVNADTDSGHAGKFLDILVLRLDNLNLERIVKHFGFERVHAAILRTVPAKAEDFSKKYINYYVDPIAEKNFAAGREINIMAGPGPTLEYTPYEIYLSFRTAPFGAALGVSASLYETAVYMSGPLTVAGGAGYAIGTAIVGLVQTYNPELWAATSDTLGPAIDAMMKAILPTQQGQAQQNAGLVYQLTPDGTIDMSHFGGDYSVTQSWEDNMGYGNNRPIFCGVDFERCALP